MENNRFPGFTAQRNGCGSGGTGETPSQLCTISGKTRLRASGGAAVRLEPVLLECNLGWGVAGGILTVT